MADQGLMDLLLNAADSPRRAVWGAAHGLLGPGRAEQAALPAAGGGLSALLGALAGGPHAALLAGLAGAGAGQMYGEHLRPDVYRDVGENAPAALRLLGDPLLLAGAAEGAKFGLRPGVRLAQRAGQGIQEGAAALGRGAKGAWADLTGLRAPEEAAPALRGTRLPGGWGGGIGPEMAQVGPEGEALLSKALGGAAPRGASLAQDAGSLADTLSPERVLMERGPGSLRLRLTRDLAQANEAEANAALGMKGPRVLGGQRGADVAEALRGVAGSAAVGGDLGIGNPAVRDLLRKVGVRLNRPASAYEISAQGRGINARQRLNAPDSLRQLREAGPAEAGAGAAPDMVASEMASPKEVFNTPDFQGAKEAEAAAPDLARPPDLAGKMKADLAAAQPAAAPRPRRPRVKPTPGEAATEPRVPVEPPAAPEKEPPPGFSEGPQSVDEALAAAGGDFPKPYPRSAQALADPSVPTLERLQRLADADPYFLDEAVNRGHGARLGFGNEQLRRLAEAAGNEEALAALRPRMEKMIGGLRQMAGQGVKLQDAMGRPIDLARGADFYEKHGLGVLDALLREAQGGKAAGAASAAAEVRVPTVAERLAPDQLKNLRAALAAQDRGEKAAAARAGKKAGPEPMPAASRTTAPEAKPVTPEGPAATETPAAEPKPLRQQLTEAKAKADQEEAQAAAKTARARKPKAATAPAAEEVASAEAAAAPEGAAPKKRVGVKKKAAAESEAPTYEKRQMALEQAHGAMSQPESAREMVDAANRVMKQKPTRGEILEIMAAASQGVKKVAAAKDQQLLLAQIGAILKG